MILTKKRFPIVAFALASFTLFGLVNAPVAFGQSVEPVTTQATTDDIYTGLSGEVLAVSESGVATQIASDGTGTLVMSSPEDGEFVVTLSADYELRTPGMEAPADVSGVLAVGAKVAVLATTTEAGELVASQVLVKPARPTTTPVTGAVVSRDGNTITVAKPDGTTKTIEIPTGAPVPEEGEIVTAFIPEQGSAGAAAASQGLVRAEEVSQRLNDHLQEQLGELETSDLPAEQKQAIEDRLARVAALFEDHATARVDAIGKVLALPNLPDGARTHLESALGRAQAGFERAMTAAGGARESAGLPDDAGRPEAGGRPEGSGRP
jgi:hypothetical protein